MPTYVNDLYKVIRNGREYNVSELIDNQPYAPQVTLPCFKDGANYTITGNQPLCSLDANFDYINGEVDSLPEFTDNSNSAIKQNFIKRGILVSHYSTNVPTHNIIDSSSCAANGDHELKDCHSIGPGTYYLAMKDATTLGLYTNENCTTPARVWNKTCEWKSSYFTRGIIPDRINLVMVSGGGGGGSHNIFNEYVVGGGGGGAGATASIILNLTWIKQPPYKDQYKFKIVIGSGGAGGISTMPKTGASTFENGHDGGASEIYWLNHAIGSPLLMLSLSGGTGGQQGYTTTGSYMSEGRGGIGGKMSLGDRVVPGGRDAGGWWWEYCYQGTDWKPDGRAYFDRVYDMAGNGGNGSKAVNSRGGAGKSTASLYYTSTIASADTAKQNKNYYIYIPKKSGGVSSYGVNNTWWRGGGGGASAIMDGRAPTATIGAAQDPNFVYPAFGNGGGGGGFWDNSGTSTYKDYMNGNNGGDGALWLFY